MGKEPGRRSAGKTNSRQARWLVYSAARAGEAGDGFAVVANEVGVLASRSTILSAEIIKNVTNANKWFTEFKKES